MSSRLHTQAVLNRSSLDDVDVIETAAAYQKQVTRHFGPGGGSPRTCGPFRR